MAIAAIFIAVYHLWIPVFPAGGLPGQVERFIIDTILTNDYGRVSKAIDPRSDVDQYAGNTP